MLVQGSYLAPLGFNFIGWMGDLVAPIIAAVITILTPIVGSFLKLVGTLLKTLFSALLFHIYTVILTVVDLCQYMFNRLSGAKLIHRPSQTALKLGSYMNNYYMNLGVVKTAFWSVVGLCLVLCFVFTVVSVARASMDLSGKFAVGEVLRNAMKAFLTFFLLQVMTLSIMSLSNYTLTAVDDAMGAASGRDSGSSDVRLANIIFTCSAVNAAKDGNKDLFQAGTILYRYYNGPGAGDEDGLMFNREHVDQDFDYREIDYVMGGVCCILMAYVLLSCMFLFVQRTFEVIFLFMVSPFFVASMPLDGGSRYKAWKDLFVAKCIASYGAVISMRLFFMFVPLMMGGKSGVNLDGIVTSSYAYFVRLIFVIGAGFAVKKSQVVMLRIVNPQAAGQAEQALGGAGAVFSSVKGITTGLGDAIRGKKT